MTLKRALLFALCGLALAILVLGYLLFVVEIDLATARAMANDALNSLSEVHPLVLFAAIALLPLVGVPVSPLLIAGGVAYGPVTGLLIGFIGIAINDALGYWLASSVFRKWIEGFIEKRGWRIPVFPDTESIKIVAIFRLTPGFPLPAQNYLLGLARVPFFTYLWVSIVAQSIPVSGFVLTGGSIFEGSWGLVIVGISLIVVMAVATKMVLKYYGKQFAQSGVVEP